MHDDGLMVEEHPSADDLHFLEQQIIRHNYAAAGAEDGRALAVFLRDDQGALLAGLAGYTWAGMFEIEFLWVDERLRGQGHGARLLAAAEEEARARGCQVAITGSYSFQAPQFYQSCGYKVVGAVEDWPPGHVHYLLRKRL